MKTALEIIFWVCAALIVWTQLGYAAALAVLVRVFGRAALPTPASAEPSPRTTSRR